MTSSRRTTPLTTATRASSPVLPTLPTNCVLEWQGQGLTWKTNIFLMHAEDQLMAADTFETIASEFIEVHQELQELKSRDGRG